MAGGTDAAGASEEKETLGEVLVTIGYNVSEGKPKQTTGKEKKPLITYGLFDGVGRRDHLVVAAVLGPEDYTEIYGRGLEDYYDYLLKLEDALYDIEEPVRIIRLPFHRDIYREWLAGFSWFFAVAGGRARETSW